MSKESGYFYRPKPIGRFLFLLLFLLFVMNLLFNFVFVPLQVRSGSMRPEVKVGERLIYSPVPVRWLKNLALERGALVVLTPPYLEKITFGKQLRNAILRFFTFNGVDLNQEKLAYLNPYMVRRVIAVPGDVIKLDGFVALVKRKGESYFASEFEGVKVSYQLELDDGMNNWPSGFPASGRMNELRLGEGEYFVLSDNRYTGNDSRHWGAVTRGRILGRVIWRY